jgi:two-component system, OmpR family, sensor kinase
VKLRTRLILSFTALLLVAIVVVGIVAIGSVRTVLVDQIDTELLEAASRGGRPGPRPGFDPPDEPFARSVAVVYLSPEGEVVVSSPSGFGDEPDPLPDLSGLADDFVGFTEVSSVDGTLDYRALVGRSDEGYVAAWAAPLREVDDAAASLIRVLLVAGLVIAAVGAAGTWWTVRSGMKPVDRMVETATAIAAGDLSQRVEEAGPDTELGRLSVAFNEMLAHIEDAMTAEQEAQDRLRRFVADASHELRTPIAAIGGYAELHRQGALVASEEIDRAMGRIEKESARMQRLVEDLLLLARIDETTAIERMPVDLVALVGDAVEDHRAIDQTRPVTVTAPEALVVQGDEQRLAQVVANLLGNVRVHTPEGTKVDVGLTSVDGSAALTVGDDGPGIADDALDQAFDRFYRLDPSQSRRSGGAGLGLAIAAAVVNAHGGTIAASRSDEGGALITVTLPA